MTLRDLIAISTGNLWRMKLRAFLTISGIVIAIAAFVSMLSFGAGNQEYVSKQFNDLGLFSTMQVYPKNKSNGSDTSSSVKLDRTALERIAAVPGVNLVYPYDALSVKVKLGDSLIDSKAQALPSAAIRTKLFSKLRAGKPFDSDSSREVIISDELAKKAGFNIPDSILGKSLVVSVRISTIDSGLGHILIDRGETVLDRLKRIKFDSLFNSKYRSYVIRNEMNSAVRRFLNGFMNAQQEIRDTLTICGVRELMPAGRLRVEPIILPIAAAARFSTSGFGGSPTEIFAAMSSGNLFSEPGDKSGKTFSQVTIDLDPHVLYKSVKDSVETMGFKTFSFAEQFEQIQKAFFYFDLALAVVGLIALITASLGIVNTMVMSITERKREIGVLKSLGADELEIRGLFLVESGVIGFIGTIVGILFGWTITRVVSTIAKMYMNKEGIPAMELFALPMWLILIALGVGIGVSVLAGLFPAARAAHVDPVEALRND
jgi:ABC-type antimicrobial peptide transport system permease subunit